MKLRLAEMREQVAAIPDPALIEANHQKFLELMKNLAQLHQNADPDGKRTLVENCFSNRRVIGKYVELEPYDWLQMDENDDAVFFGAPERYKDRTSETPHKPCPQLQLIMDAFKRHLCGDDSNLNDAA